MLLAEHGSVCRLPKTSSLGLGGAELCPSEQLHESQIASGDEVSICIGTALRWRGAGATTQACYAGHRRYKQQTNARVDACPASDGV